jgi:hypothetical protein
MAALVVGTLAACGHPGPAARGERSAAVPASLNGLSASQLVDDFRKAGLPVLNPHDITAQECPKEHCVQGVSTDTVAVFKFPTTGLAQRYIGSRSNVFQVEDLVLTFAPKLPGDLKQRYEREVEIAVQ